MLSSGSRYRGRSLRPVAIIGWFSGSVAHRSSLRRTGGGTVTGQGRNIIIEDDGESLDPALLQRLVSRGAQAPAKAAGSAGIGLSIVMEIISLYDGRMEFARSAMGGLSVTLYALARSLTVSPDTRDSLPNPAAGPPAFQSSRLACASATPLTQ